MAEQDILREQLERYVQRAGHGVIQQIADGIGVHRQSVANFRMGKAMRPENMDRLRTYLSGRGFAFSADSTIEQSVETYEGQSTEKKEEAMSGLADRLLGLSKIIRNPAIPREVRCAELAREIKSFFCVTGIPWAARPLHNPLIPLYYGRLRLCKRRQKLHVLRGQTCSLHDFPAARPVTQNEKSRPVPPDRESFNGTCPPWVTEARRRPVPRDARPPRFPARWRPSLCCCCHLRAAAAEYARPARQSTAQTSARDSRWP